jgi:murein L,D-transpeptidase YafK
MPVVNKISKKETVESIVDRVEHEVWNRLEEKLNLAGYKMDYPHKITLIGLKEERLLQIYAHHEAGIKLIKEYPLTAYSGTLGPKLKEGDKQIPEGIYKVEYLNPNSSYYLSIKIDYPNDFDKQKTTMSNISDMGGDIFIHGKAATIGCLPIGDMGIEEVFLLTSKAYNNEIQVIISPRDFRVNKEYPEIEGIDWEAELYDSIKEELEKFPSV